jgi:CheY-like chemotaxis protein/signal transduction histidine kinase
MLLSPSNPIIKLKHPLTISNGRQITVTTVFRALYDENLSHTGYLLVTRNITREMQSLEELIAAKKAEESRTKSKAMILASLNHDLRTPLNSIIGMTEVLLDTSLDADQQEDAQVIQKSAFKLLSLLNSLADFTKTEAGQIIFTNDWFNLKTDLFQMIKLPGTGLAETKTEVKLNIISGVPEKIYGDPKRIGQILSYLVFALASFAHNETIKINIDSKSEDNNHVNLLFKIESKVDIPGDFSDKIIKFLDRGEADISHENAELALGLAVSKNLCNLMGGSISFGQNEEQGPAFQFSVLAETENRNGTSSVSILVVEDNLLNQKVVGATLKKKGHTFDLAGDGKTALEKFKQNRFDFILMDIQMPVMDGYETTRQIRSFEKENPVGTVAKIYALTVNATSEDKKKCLAVGMNGFFAKPFKFFELEKIIHQIADEK